MKTIITCIAILSSQLVIAQNQPNITNTNLPTIDILNEGITYRGVGNQDLSGYRVSSIGDINTDGFDDVIIGAYRNDANGVDAGAAYVIFGSADGRLASSTLPGTHRFGVDLGLLNGQNGFVINGAASGDSFGWSASSVGDINDDGIDDFAVGADWSAINGPISGSVYVIYGRTYGFPQEMYVTNINGINGFAIHGLNPNTQLGFSVSGAGDVNGDGVADMVIGAPYTSFLEDRLDGAFVIFGQSNFPATFDLNSLNGNNGFAFRGNNNFSFVGFAVSSAGDFNADGYDDVLVSAPREYNTDSHKARTYLIYGNDQFPAELKLTDMNGNNGFFIKAPDVSTSLGFDVGDAGDFNGDGISDLIIGMPNNGNLPSRKGASYIVFGRENFTGNHIDLTNINGTNGVRINGLQKNDGFGYSVSGGKDVNADGFDDVIIGAPGYNTDLTENLGGVAVIFGSDSTFTSTIPTTSLLRPRHSHGFFIEGINDQDALGVDVCLTNDVNGDGIDDIIIGAPGADFNGLDAPGQSYLIYGKQGN